jgi:Holliday junction resolvase RusA-like endonuclease
MKSIAKALIVLNGNPISTNNCYKNVRVNIRILSDKARTLKEDYQWQLKKQWKYEPLDEPLEISIKIYFGTKRNYDWDNFHKLSMDSLTGIVWVDDSLIQKATVQKFYDKENPRIEIEIKSFSA